MRKWAFQTTWWRWYDNHRGFQFEHLESHFITLCQNYYFKIHKKFCVIYTIYIYFYRVKFMIHYQCHLNCLKNRWLSMITKKKQKIIFFINIRGYPSYNQNCQNTPNNDIIYKMFMLNRSSSRYNWVIINCFFFFLI